MLTVKENGGLLRQRGRLQKRICRCGRAWLVLEGGQLKVIKIANADSH